MNALQSELVLQRSAVRCAITRATRIDESEAVSWLMQHVKDDASANETTVALARKLVTAVRQDRAHSSGVDALMQEFSLSSDEGVALMCLAEALLRIPDHQMADRLIADKISRGDWCKHHGESPSLFVNAVSWGLLITGKQVQTDLSYLVCAKKLLRAADILYPQFATQNAHTLAAIHTTAQRMNVHGYEFQCLYGMGETLYDQVVPAAALGTPCRIYTPVGTHHTLLAYMVRRLLENGANSSFVSQLVDPQIDIDTLLRDPVKHAAQFGGTAHPGIVLPAALFGDERRNSAGLDFTNEVTLAEIVRGFAELAGHQWHATALVCAQEYAPGRAFSPEDIVQPRYNPADRRDHIGDVVDASNATVTIALDAAEKHTLTWQTRASSERGATLTRAADLLEQHTIELMLILILEAGKSLPNAIAEVREAVDFLRY